jgi:nucleoside phosphorylase
MSLNSLFPSYATPPNAFPLVVTPTALENSAVQNALKRYLLPSPVQSMICGVGEGQSRLFCQKIDRNRVSCLVLLGWAGGLAPSVAAGDVVCADAALRDGQPPLSCRALPIKNARRGPILTVAKALLTPAEKQSAQASGALAVEMEAYPLAEWAGQAGIPFVHARVILDTLDESLPDFGDGVDASAGLRVGRFLKRLARHPGLAWGLWKLNARIRLINPALENLALEILRVF